MNSTNKGLCGIANLGNTCWVNSILQCLSNTPGLRNYFLSNSYINDINPNNEASYTLVETFNNLLKILWKVDAVIDPTPFIKLLPLISSEYTSGTQQDSQEFLLLLLDKLHTAVSYEISLRINGAIKNEIDKIEHDSLIIWRNEFKKSYSYIIQEIYGQFIAVTKCNLCKYKSYKYDVFNHISLPITDECNDIYDCFDIFTKQEVLDDDNKLKCDSCNEFSNAHKYLSIWRTSNTLLISFKRFDMYGNKINKHINFPTTNLNLQKYINGYSKHQSVYNLYAVCNHYGMMNCGHYTAFCKNIDTNWYQYNDDQVTQLELNDVVTDSAYILFYIKQ
jgi:ubiquitin C-terminal hydrolase